MKLLLLLGAAVLLHAADEDAKIAIQRIVADNFQAMRAARSKDDLVRALDAMDVREWIGELPNGQIWNRADALRQLEPMLAVPVEKRGSPKIDFLYWNETAACVTDVYWVDAERDGTITGSIARDTWVRTAAGWRRTRHQKFFPDRPLVENGKAVILPR